MKKTYIIFLLPLLVIIFSGCSLPSTQNTGGAAKDFTLSQSIWKSSDGGKTWEVKNKGEGKANETSVEVLSFAVNPYDANNIYAGLRSGGILETTNGGETWNFINNYISEKVYGLVLDPSDGKTLYASGVWEGKGKMFKTNDRGENWEEIYTSPSKGPLIVSLTIDKKNASVLYATTSDKEVLKTADGGKTWKNILIAQAPVLKVAVDAADSNLIYLVTTSGMVMRSRDAGDNFESINDKFAKITGRFGSGEFTVLETDPSQASRVYLAGKGGLAVSKNGGDSWEKINTLNDPYNFPIKALAINPANPNELVYGASAAAYKSTDGGATWTTSQFDNKMVTNVLEYNPVDTNVVYLGFSKK